MKKLGKFWTNLLIWISSYVSFLGLIAFGYLLYEKDGEKECKKEYKKALIVYAIFLAIDIVLSIFYNFIFSVCGVKNADLSNVYYKIRYIANTAELIVYAVFAILVLVNKNKTNDSIDFDQDEEEQE